MMGLAWAPIAEVSFFLFFFHLVGESKKGVQKLGGRHIPVDTKETESITFYILLTYTERVLPLYLRF